MPQQYNIMTSTAALLKPPNPDLSPTKILVTRNGISLFFTLYPMVVGGVLWRYCGRRSGWKLGVRAAELVGREGMGCGGTLG